MDKSFALIALQFPPIGGGYSERMAGFAKYWCRVPDVRVHVITADLEGLDLPIDEKVAEEVVSGVASITRLPTLPAQMNTGMLKTNSVLRLLSKAILRLVPLDGHLFWSLNAARTASQLYKSGKVTAILTSSTPYSVHLAGLLLKRWHPELTWVADFRDPWTTNYQQKHKRQFPGENKLYGLIEQAIYDWADQTIINTHRNLQDLKNNFRIDSNKIRVIQNGYDDEIPFDVPAALPKVRGKFRLGYIGGFRGDWFEGPFLEALSVLKDTNPTYYECLDVPLIGVEKVRGNLANDLGVADKLHCKGFFPRSELGSWIASLDALLLVLPNNSDQPLGWVPQRLYLYMATGLPVLCIAPEGEAAEYVSQTDSGIVCEPNDSVKIAKILVEWIRKPPKKKTACRPEVSKYSKRVLSSEFLDVLFQPSKLRRVDDLSREKKG